MELPRLLYKAGGTWELESGSYALLQVDDQAALDAALADGWHLDQYAAKAAAEPAEAEIDEHSPPTRAELEQRAAELGIKVDGRWSDKRLAAKLEKA